MKGIRISKGFLYSGMATLHCFVARIHLCQTSARDSPHTSTDPEHHLHPRSCPNLRGVAKWVELT